ncbi:MAG TPA: histidinol phosphate phosphatase domain-containing protein [Candidatus Thermoplasmatota archaeon]|nr:histidinol phosphate phosphatase domain-containing protein [Candidatus Thermoplasmatota archaeon]
MRADFHSHTFLSDGELVPMEHVRRAKAAGHAAIALTDHVGVDDAEFVLPRLIRECRIASEEWKIHALPGVEITHVPVRLMERAVKSARKAGAVIVVVHGETPVEPVLKGTNAAAVRTPGVDVLAHPGLLTKKDASAARDNGVFLEITGRRGHSLANGNVVRVGREAGASFVVDSDAHAPENFMTEEFARTVALGAGLDAKEVEKAFGVWPRELLKRHGVG